MESSQKTCHTKYSIVAFKGSRGKSPSRARGTPDEKVGKGKLCAYFSKEEILFSETFCRSLNKYPSTIQAFHWRRLGMQFKAIIPS